MRLVGVLMLIALTFLSFIDHVLGTTSRGNTYADSTGKHDTFSVPRLRRQGPLRNGAAARARVFNRMGWSLPPELESNAQRMFTKPDFATTTKSALASFAVDTYAQPTAIGSVPSLPEMYQSEYLSLITIGGQTMQIDIDTGSSDFWVFSTLLPARERVGHQYIYNPYASATFTNLTGLKWAITYGDGSAAMGIVGQDTINIGGLIIENQAIELATRVTQGFTADKPNDGLLGMGFSNINNVHPVRQRTLFDNMRSPLARPLFVANLKEDGSGTFDFGYVNRSLWSADAQLATVPVDPTNGFWQFTSQVYSIGQTITNKSGASPAIADSGTSLLLVDPDVAATYWHKVKGAVYAYYYGGWVFPCSQPLPDFGIAVGTVTKTGAGTTTGRLIRVPGWMLTYARVEPHYCYGSIQSNGGYELQVYG